MIKSLQVGRGVAAMAVAAMHLSIIFADPRYTGAAVFGAMTAQGGLGVDFFFVLSGFIIMFAHRSDVGQPAALRAYVVKRFVRVYPIYWIFTVIKIAGGAASGGMSVPPHGVLDALSMITLVRFNSYATPIGAAWTLYHEITFYIMFALLLTNRKLGIAALAIWFGSVVVLFHYAPHGDWTFGNTLLSANNLSFLCGIVAFFLSERLRQSSALVALVAGVTLFAAILFALKQGSDNPLLLLGCSIAFMLLIAGMVGLEHDGWVREVPLLGLVGNASYTLYLSHESVESTLMKLAARAGLLRTLDPRILYLVIFAGAVASAIGFYLIVERPLLRAVRHVFGTRARRPSGDPEKLESERGAATG